MSAPESFSPICPSSRPSSYRDQTWVLSLTGSAVRTSNSLPYVGREEDEEDVEPVGSLTGVCSFQADLAAESPQWLFNDDPLQPAVTARH